MANAVVGARHAVSLLLFGVVTVLVVGWRYPAFPQTSTKTWKTVEELSAEERAMLDLRPDTPRDPQIPYLPAEAYPFSPPYTAEELGYLAFELDTLRPRFSHIWLSVVQSMTAGGYILATMKNNTSILYFPKNGLGELLHWPPGQEYMRAFSQFTNPPESDGDQQLWFEYRTDHSFTKKQDRYMYRPSLRRIRRQPQPRREDRFPNNAQSFDDLQGRDPWEFTWKLLGTDVLSTTVRFPNTRPLVTITQQDGSTYDRNTTTFKPMGDTYPAYTPDGGVECYVVESTPRPEWLPDYYRSKLITWIDKKFFCPLRIEQYDHNGKLILIAERLERSEYPEDGRLGYTPLIVHYWTTDIDLMTAGFHDYHKKMNWLDDHWETYFSAEFLRRGWFLSSFKSRGEVPTPAQFYLRPLLYRDKFPEHRPIVLAPEVEARIAAQEAEGHIVFETNGQKSGQ
ncbi:MAG: DUF1329 domain-containing protein [Deltaproteobacteria bacterium]|nr:DUF1329 domain-containing protein [Deltaproteobacteria bacterium]